MQVVTPAGFPHPVSRSCQRFPWTEILCPAFPHLFSLIFRRLPSLEPGADIRIPGFIFHSRLGRDTWNSRGEQRAGWQGWSGTPRCFFGKLGAGSAGSGSGMFPFLSGMSPHPSLRRSVTHFAADQSRIFPLAGVLGTGWDCPFWWKNNPSLGFNYSRGSKIPAHIP